MRDTRGLWMIIYCKKCKKKVGVIGDAALKPGIIYLCKEFNVQREALELRYNNKTNKNPYEDIFGDIFK
jgi:hypothetical protein